MLKTLLARVRHSSAPVLGPAAALALLVVAGCTTDKEPRATAVPQSPAATVTVNDPDEGDAPQVAKTSPDGYPTFSAPLTAANTQMSDEEAAGLSARLSSLARARKAGTVSEAEYQRQLQILRKLAAEHGVDAEAAIAN